MKVLILIPSILSGLIFNPSHSFVPPRLLVLSRLFLRCSSPPMIKGQMMFMKLIFSYTHHTLLFKVESAYRLINTYQSLSLPSIQSPLHRPHLLSKISNSQPKHYCLSPNLSILRTIVYPSLSRSSGVLSSTDFLPVDDHTAQFGPRNLYS